MENLDDARFCQVCTRELPLAQLEDGFTITRQGHVVQSVPSKTSEWRTVAIVIIIIAVTIGAVVSAFIFIKPKAHADLVAMLYVSVRYDQVAAGPGVVISGPGGVIEVSGPIYNYGRLAGSETVHLHVYDGTSWYDYNESTGLVPADGWMPFDWSAHYDYLDVLSYQVQYTVTTD